MIDISDFHTFDILYFLVAVVFRWVALRVARSTATGRLLWVGDGCVLGGLSDESADRNKNDNADPPANVFVRWNRDTRVKLEDNLEMHGGEGRTKF